MMSYPIPDHPYQIVSSDVFENEGKHYIVAVCHYSDYIDVKPLRSVTTKETIHFFNNIFATQGIPLLLITDNGTNYTSAEFAQFMNELGVHHVTSSPHHHQSNGRAEAAVKVAKSLLKRAENEAKPLWLLLLAQRNTPSKGMDSSPAQRLMSRRTRTLLPAPKKPYRPAIPEDVVTKLETRKRKNKQYRDQGIRVKDLPELLVGQPVRVKANPQLRRDPWVPAHVNRNVRDHSWEVVVAGKGPLVRNRTQVRETLEPTQLSPL